MKSGLKIMHHAQHQYFSNWITQKVHLENSLEQNPGPLPGDSNSVGLGRTQEIASLHSRCQYIFESYCSALSHFWPLVLVQAIRSHQGPLIVPRVSSFAQSGPVITNVCVALIDLEVQVVVLGHP